MTELANKLCRRWMVLLERIQVPSVMFGLLAISPYLSLVVSSELILKDSLYCDYASYQLPIREFAQQEFAAGRFPLWIPELGCGIPLHATGQVGLAYPFLTPLLFVFDANLAIKIALLVHVVVCYVGQYRLGRILGLSNSASGLSGIIACQGGYLTAHLAAGHVAHIFAYSLFPSLFLAICKICRRPTLPAMSLFAIVVAVLLLVGNPQLPYYGLLFGGVWAFASLAFGHASVRRLRCLCMFSTGLVLGILIAAIQLVPTLELLQDNAGMTSRGKSDYAGNYALDGLDLYRLVVPSLRGNPMVEIPEFKAPDFYHEKVCYLGAITWMLAFTSIYSPFTRRWPWGAAGLIVLGIVIALGRSTVLFNLIGSIVPGLFLFRCPGRCLSVVSILLALLAGRGFDAAFSPKQRLSKIATRAVTGFLFFTACSATMVIDRSVTEFNLEDWLEFAMEHLRTDLNCTAVAFIAAMTCTVYLSLMNVRIASLAVAVILVADLGYFNLRCVQFEQHDPPPPPQDVLASAVHYRFIEAQRTAGFSSEEVRYSRMVGQAVRYGTPMIGTNEGGVLPFGCEAIFLGTEKNADTALRLLSCNFIAQRSVKPTWKRIPNPLPRIRFMGRVKIRDLQETFSTVILPAATTQESEDNSVEVVIDEPQSLKIRVHAANDGVLIVADTFYPGWQCIVNGQSVPVERVLGAVRGVRLLSGEHLVEMRYQPKSFLIGCVLSLCGIVIVGLLLLVSVFAGRVPSRYSPEPVNKSPDGHHDFTSNSPA